MGSGPMGGAPPPHWPAPPPGWPVGSVAGGAAPDLRKSYMPLNAESFDAVVRDGALMARGMPAFGQLSDQEVEGLAHYIRQRTRETMPQTDAE